MRSPEPAPARGVARGVARAIAGGLKATGAAVVSASAAVAMLALSPGAALAASPTPSPQVGDPRSGGQGPGLVGDPLLAIGVVVAIGMISLLATLAYVRATAGRRAAGP